ncbi:hypothetical protein DFP72DRAFT_1153152 [Ephemerocybe angulata]|uniref:Uncharacterized protein n=1 Tax=Ephemerocybe angulata TaxID=980116 RepID=A0A8H6HFG5_9AGAR|nr:hypothetical protein DFP72DRAFT_1153152 [Tulosesus angulatus]
MNFKTLALLSSFILAAVAIPRATTPLSVSTPASVETCKEVILKISGGTPPYTLTVNEGAPPHNEIENIIGPVASRTIIWGSVGILPGTSIVFQVTDSANALTSSAVLTVGGPGTHSVNASVCSDSELTRT